MSEPVTSASMALDAYFKYQSDLQDGRSPQEAWQRNRENIGRTTAVYAVSAILLAAVQSVADAWRDDDDDKNALEKYWSAFAGNVVDELMPFNKLPIFSDFYDIAKQMISIFGVDGSEISARYALKRRVVTTVSGSYLTLADNTEYDLTNIEVLNISYPTGKFECYMKLALSTGSSIGISFPAGTTYIGTVPQFGVGETWEISIKDGIVVAGKAVAS